MCSDLPIPAQFQPIMVAGAKQAYHPKARYFSAHAAKPAVAFVSSQPPELHREPETRRKRGSRWCYQCISQILFFFCCIAERAIKPCRSSRSKLRGEFGIPRHLQNRNQNTTKTNKPNKNTKQTKDKSRQVLECETRGEKRVKRPKQPNALICRTPGGSMRYP